MSLHDTLHLIAIVATVLAIVVHPGFRDRSCAPDLSAGICMLVAMVDGMWLRIIPVVYAMALLLAAAIAFSAVGAVRERRGRSAGTVAGKSSHAPLGFVATAVCLPFMHGSAISSAADQAHHGLGAGSLVVVMIAICGGYAAMSLRAAGRARGWDDRAQYLLMGGGASMMAFASTL